MIPTNKVASGVVAGAIVGLIVWASKQFAKVDVPVEAASSLSVVVTFIVQWLVPDSEA
jgi:uncharacterized membrane protein YGL010W